MFVGTDGRQARSPGVDHSTRHRAVCHLPPARDHHEAGLGGSMPSSAMSVVACMLCRRAARHGTAGSRRTAWFWDAGAETRARTRDTHCVAHADVVQVTEAFGDECRVYVIGRRSSLNVSRYRDFLRRNHVASRWVDIDRDPLVALLGVQQLEARHLPLFLFADGTVLETPVPDRPALFAEMRSELAERVGLHARPSKEEYDLLIVGAGPAGLTAAVYAASEGLDTVVVERHAPGGQAGTSSRIENFPGFPHGVSGRELAEAIYAQALRFGAEIVVGADMVEARREPDGKIGITLVNGARVRA